MNTHQKNINTAQLKVKTKYMVTSMRHLMNQNAESRELEGRKHELADLGNKQKKKINPSNKSRPH